jgi:AcrR family transcriptional regulator
MPFDRVIAAAVELVDEVGVAEFSMRLLAQRLNSSTATLYRNFTGKDEILVHVLDRVLAEVPESVRGETGAGSWREQIVTLAEALFRTLEAHPHVVSLFGPDVPLGPNGVRAREAMLGTLLAGGFPPELAVNAYTTIARHVIGLAAQVLVGASDPQYDEDVRRFCGSLDPAAFPATVASAPFMPRPVPDEFRFGLDLILDGLNQRLNRATG